MIRQAILKLAVRAVDKVSRGIAGAGMGLRLLSDDLNDWAESMKPESRFVVGVDPDSKDATGATPAPEPWWKTGTEAEKRAKRMELRAQLGREGPPEDWRPSSHGHPENGWFDVQPRHGLGMTYYRDGQMRGWIGRDYSGSRWEGARVTTYPPGPEEREFSMKVAAQRWVENQGGAWKLRAADPTVEDYCVDGKTVAWVHFTLFPHTWNATRFVGTREYQRRRFPIPLTDDILKSPARDVAKRWAEGCE